MNVTVKGCTECGDESICCGTPVEMQKTSRNGDIYYSNADFGGRPTVNKTKNPSATSFESPLRDNVNIHQLHTYSLK